MLLRCTVSSGFPQLPMHQEIQHRVGQHDGSNDAALLVVSYDLELDSSLHGKPVALSDHQATVEATLKR